MKEEKMEEKTKRKALFLLGTLATITAGIFCYANFTRAADSCNDHIIISQIYGGGGNSGAVYKNDFIELYNPTENDIPIDDWSVQYVSATGNFPATSSGTTVRTNLLHGKIKAKTYFLLQEKSFSDEGQPLENPDNLGFINLAADKGKIALVSSTTLISSENDPLIEDFVIYSGGSNTKSIFRKIDSCPSALFTDTPNPRNSSIVEEDEEPQNDIGSDQSEEENNDDTADTSEKCVTSSKDIKLNEIFPYPGSGNEFVEITNIGKNCVDVSGWKIMDEASHKKTFSENSIIHPGKYLFLEGNLYLNNDSDAVYLLAADVDAKSEALDNVQYEKAKKDFSFGLNGENWQWTSTPTPGEENIITITDSKEGSSDAGSEENYSAAEKVYLNEILPSPKGGSDDEYIEIVNGENDPVDLFGWRLKDASKSKGYQFKDHALLNPGEYLAIYRPESKLALNNFNESVYLYNPEGKITSSASFEKSRKNASYSFDGESWRWSKYLTPGKKNRFDSEPAVKIKKPKNAFKDLYTEFSAKAKDKETKNLKYVWDFGDGKKSHLAKTSHKYLATGKYTVTLAVSDDSQTIEKSFALAVKNYPRPDLEIVKIVPNPAGRDSDGEIVEIRNGSGKKIGLKGWKIATGSGEKLYNHPINSELALAPDETKIITREICKFSLNNKAGKVQLVYPDGKVADKMEYKKDKIKDDEVYAKADGKWQWISPPEKENEKTKEEIKSESEKSSESEGITEGISDSKYFNSNFFDYGLLQENNVLVFTKYFLPADDILSGKACCSAKNIPTIFFPFVTWNSRGSEISPLASMF